MVTHPLPLRKFTHFTSSPTYTSHIPSCIMSTPNSNTRYSRTSASSVFHSNSIGQSHGQGNLNSDQAWSSANNREGEWYAYLRFLKKTQTDRCTGCGRVSCWRHDFGQLCSFVAVQVANGRRGGQAYCWSAHPATSGTERSLYMV